MSEADSTQLHAEDLLADQVLEDHSGDAFNNWAIAQRLADLVAEAEPPVNIALFGAWGSGKSSMFPLLQSGLRDRRSTAQVVRYDAWKYGGESLQRNFISHAAHELGFPEKDAPEFHRGLYERKRKTEVDLKQLDRKHLNIIGIFLVVFVGFLIAFELVAGTASVFTDEDFLGEIGRDLPRFLAPAGVLAVLLGIVKAILDGASAETEQSQPAADEQFARSFEDLRTGALRKHRCDRLVFFVDELDRCLPEDVVATLVAIRTFLDVEGCIFVVAADRDVLERALVADRRRVVPLNVENPYYTSASEFIDKIFAHQIQLPPLRARRLTRFARDLVGDRGGLWGDLVAAQDGGKLLDRVMYVLVPSHVRSPRRVKVLLNAFATNSRIAEARGIDRTERALEIARLTVMQTEFPLIGADLHLEPRLPTLLFESPANPSPRLEALLAKHQGIASDSVATDVSLAEGAEVTETEADDLQQLAEVSRRQTQQLERYLERLQAVDAPEIGRDLLYLEAAGAALGLTDAALGEILETNAADSPRRVVSALREHKTEEQLKAILVLSDMVEQEFGAEQSNVLLALLQSVALIDDDDDLVVIADTVADRVVMALGDNETATSEQYLSLLRLGVLARRPLLTDTALAAPQALSVEGLDEVLSYYSALGRTARAKVRSAMAGSLAETDAGLAAALRSLDGDDAREVLADIPVSRALMKRLEDQDIAASTAEALYDALDDRVVDPALLVRLQRTLLVEKLAYPAVRARASWSAAILTDPNVRTEHALLALEWSPPADWSIWSTWIDSQAELDEPAVARTAMNLVLRSGGVGDAETRRAAESLLKQLAPLVGDLDGIDIDETVAVVAELLDPQPWWTGKEPRLAQEELHRLIRAVAEPGSPMGDAVRDRLLDDVRRPLSAGVMNVQSAGVVTAVDASLSPSALNGVGNMGPPLGPSRAANLYTAWSAFSNSAALIQARLQLAVVAIDGEIELDPPRPGVSDLQPFVGSAGTLRNTLVSTWLRLAPSLDEVLELCRWYWRPGTSAAQPIDDWMEGLDRAQRTGFVLALVVQEPRAHRWIRPARRHGVDELEVTRAIDARVRTLTRHEARERLVEVIEVLEPTTPAAQRQIAELVVWMLQRRTKVDLRIALRLARSLRPGFGSARTVTDELKATVDKLDVGIPSGSANDLKRIGIRLPKRSLTQSARRRLERAARRR
jgi:hypothetical protein